MAQKSGGPYKLDALRVKPQFGPEEKPDKLTKDLVQLIHSFGYQCVGSPNVCIADAKTAILAAGSTVLLFDFNKKQHKYLHTISGGGIGHIVVHPKKRIFAVAEKGCQPSINLFSYPTLKLSKMLHGGTERVYVYLRFNPNGNLLASVGGPPDFSLTVWQWEKETILLRSKAFSQDVWSVSFSPYLHGQLTTSGVGHIRFWKMANSFTGLKLQGEIGRFGQIEISDIHSSVHLADGKVISGSEWGFLLIWDGGIVHAQVRRTNGKPCHIGIIHQLILDEGGELITLGADGWIRIWDVESMESVEPEEEAGFLELDPVNELLVSKKARLSHMVPVPNEKNIFFVENANGSIWQVDLSFSITSKAPECVFSGPGLGVTGCEMCSVSLLFAVSAMDGSIHIFDCETKTTLCSAEFNAGVSSLMWASKQVDGRGASLIAGFVDGTLRWLGITGDEYNREYKLCLNQAIKPHTSAINCLKSNKDGNILITGGLDKTMFYFTIKNNKLFPLGYVLLDNPVSWLLWFEDERKEVVLVSCGESSLIKIETPSTNIFGDDRTSYLLQDIPLTTYKVGRMRAYWKMSWKKEEEVEAEVKDETEEATEADKAEVEGQVEGEPTEETPPVEEPVEEVVEEHEEDLQPDTPPAILCGIQSDQPGHLWLNLGDYDTGYIYEFPFYTIESELEYIELIPSRVVELPVSEKQPVLCASLSKCGHYLFLGQEDGSMIVYYLQTEWDMSSITEYWKSRQHDCQYGAVQFITISNDGRLIATAGKDGNIFLNKFNIVQFKRKPSLSSKSEVPLFDLEVEAVDIIGEETLSIEQAFQKDKEAEHIQQLEQKCQILNEEIDNLSSELQIYIEENLGLPSHIQIDINRYVMHQSIMEDLHKRTTENVELVRKQKAWKLEWHTLALKKLLDRFKSPLECEHLSVKAFSSAEEVTTFKITYLPALDWIEEDKFQEESYTEETEMVTDVKEQEDGLEDNAKSVVTPTLTPTLQDEDTSVQEVVEVVSNVQQKYEERKKKKLARKAQWDALMARKPESVDESSGEDEMIKTAREKLGDYKLKTDPNYVVPEHGRMNVAKKSEQIFKIHEMIHHVKSGFNSNAFLLKENKESLAPLHPEQDLSSQSNKISSADSEEHSQKSTEKGSAAEESIHEDVKQEKSDISAEHSISTSVESSIATTPVARTKTEGQLMAVRNFRKKYLEKKQNEEHERVLIFFDMFLHILRIEKARLDAEIKYSDSRYANLVQELDVLRRSDQQEQSLQDRVGLKFSEKENLTQKLNQIENDARESREMVSNLKNQEMDNFAALQKVLGEGNKFAKFLTKLYKKRIRQAKKEREGEEGEESDSSDFSDDDYSSEDEKPGAIITESDIDPILLHSVNTLREKRQNIDDALKRENKSIDFLRKEKDALSKKCKLVDGALQVANKEMENFQLEKQLELNKLDVLANLLMEQIIYFSDATNADIFDDLLVFYASGLDALKDRVEQLREEASQERHNQKEIYRHHVRLGNECQRLQEQVLKKKNECHREMVDKFGQDVDLDFLEELENNPQMEELRNQQKQLQSQQEDAIKLCKENIAAKKIDVLALTKENTKYLKLLSALKEERNRLSRGLEKRQKQLM